MRDIFSTALVRLTGLYLAVLTIVCLLFSGFIYQLASNEVDRAGQRQVVGFRNMLGRFMVDDRATEELRVQEANEARSRLKARLIIANIGVLAAGTVMSYYFAKRTLRPIEDNLKSQERFTSDASHELRTPLAVMRSEIEVALRDKSLKLTEAKDLLASNLEEVNTLHAMTESLLHLARNKEVGEIKSIEVARLIRSTTKKYEKQAKSSGMKLEATITEAKLVTNPEALTRAISILIDNAVRYSGKDSVIKVTSTIENELYVIIVSDNGVGIPSSLIASIFDRFTRVDQSRTKQDSRGGNGLGLSIAKQLVEAIGGTIGVESQEGQGSEFRIQLPLV